MELGGNWKGWKVVRVIGRGSFGTVYEIERDVLGTVEKAALKHITIPRDENETEELLGDGYDMTSISRRYDKYLKDIVREYTIMASLRGNTNIVICDDVEYSPREGGVGWEIFIRMELLTPILRVMDQYGRPEDAVWMGTDLCHALALCGEQHIIHRDIKPQNIFVDRRGQYKLGDFGVAKVASRTTAGTRVGTFRYMAPEVYHGQPYGAAADIYSLGLVLYWVLNRRRGPFVPLPPETPTARQEEDAQARRLCGEPLPPPADGSEELKRVVLKACAYAPEDRYRNAWEMLADLQALADTEPAVFAPAYGDETVEVEETVVQPGPSPAAAETAYVDMGPAETVGPDVTEPAPEEKAPPAPQPVPQPTPPSRPAPASVPRSGTAKQDGKRRWKLAVILLLVLAAGAVFALRGRGSQDAYVPPAELGDDPLSGVVEYGGDLYQLPAPLSAFEANGWAVAKRWDSGAVDIARQGLHDDGLFFDDLRNDIVCYGYDDEPALTLPPGITVGMDRSDLMAALEKIPKNILVTETEQGYTLSRAGAVPARAFICVDTESDKVSMMSIDIGNE